MKQQKFLGFVLVFCSIMNCSVMGERLISDGVRGNELCESAENWAESIIHSKNLNAYVDSKIISENGEGKYSISLYSGDSPYGYAVVRVQNDDCWVEYGAIGKGIESINDTIEENIQKRGMSFPNAEKSIVEIAPLNYAMIIEEPETMRVFDSYGNQMSIVEEKVKWSGASKKYKDHEELFISSKKWIAPVYRPERSITLKKYNSKTILPTQGWSEIWVGKYACGVQALLQIGLMEKVIANTADAKVNAYNKLWKYTKTVETKDSKKNTAKTGKIVYGEGGMDDAAKGFVKYLKEKGYKKSDYKTSSDRPTIKWINDKLNKNKSLLMVYGINIGGKRSGHFISILGFRRAVEVSKNCTYDYLMVYDGWDSNVAYMNYSKIDFMDCAVTYFNVKK